jgi:hypothetical protein
MLAPQATAVRVFHHCAERVYHHAFRLISVWLRWFWRLRPAPKLLALFAQIVALELLTTSSPFARSALASVVTPLALSLCLLACISILFGSTARHGNS